MTAVLPVAPAIDRATPAGKPHLLEVWQASLRAPHEIRAEAAIAAMAPLVPMIPRQPRTFAPQYYLRDNTGAPFVLQEPA
jgi:hypothetical protein